MESVGESARRIVDGMSQVIRDHATLARMELRHDMKRVARDVGGMAGAMPMLMCGYVMLNVALSLLLGMWISDPGGFALVGLVNATAGGLLFKTRMKRLRTEDKLAMDVTRRELRRDQEWLSDLQEAKT